ncbi:pilin [Pseudoxanthomonas sp. 10H]|uniref:pilin n=1 Tax=Pseudoxanthomonas sp. 10H TaxID=3242729 RepID=UPI003557C578
MNEWFYATADGQRHGPLSAQELGALAARGAIGAPTLVWREGQASWRPLQDFALELGLPTLPPPLPAAPVAAAAQPRPGGLSGCAIVALIAVAGVFVVAVLGVMAAIALPAYSDYTLRAQSSAAISQAQALQPQVTEFLDANGRCPTNDDDGFGEPASYAEGALAEVTFGEFEGSDLCGLEAILAVPGKPALDGHKVWLEYDPATSAWQCTSDAEDKYLPVSCRG